MLSVGRARYSSPGRPSGLPGVNIEFLSVGSWLFRGVLALESQAHFLAVAEHRLIHARARYVSTQLRQAGISHLYGPLSVSMSLLGDMQEWE